MIEIEYVRLLEATQAPSLLMGELTLNPEKCPGIRMFYKEGSLFCYYKDRLIIIGAGNLNTLIVKGKQPIPEKK